jgi:hypothetical protein
MYASLFKNRSLATAKKASHNLKQDPGNGKNSFYIQRSWYGIFESSLNSEVEGIDNAPVKIQHLSIGITAMTVIKLIITNKFYLVHTKKYNSVNPIHTKEVV